MTRPRFRTRDNFTLKAIRLCGRLIADTCGVPAGTTVVVVMPATEANGQRCIIERADGGLFQPGPEVTGSRTRARISAAIIEITGAR